MIVARAVLIIGAIVVANGATWEHRKESRKLFGGYRITPRICKATRATHMPVSDRGAVICMFNHECARRGGEVVGACMDGFLFGACCQLPAVEIPTLETVEPVVMDISNNHDFSEMYPHVAIGSSHNGISALEHFNKYGSATHSSTRRPQPSPDYSGSSEYTDELPSRIPVFSHTEKYNEVSDNAGLNNLLLETESPEHYNHSSISHDDADTVLVHLNGSQVTDVARPSDFSSESATASTGSGYYKDRVDSTLLPLSAEELAQKPIYLRPMFRPKPTRKPPSDNDKYVLVHTVSNQRPVTDRPESDKTPEIESIESIIMMLNDSNPEYTGQTDSMGNRHPSTRPVLSHGQTTKSPPSISYVYSPTVTKRPGYEPSHKVTHGQGISSYTTSAKPPSTSYLYSPTPTKYVANRIGVDSKTTEAYASTMKTPSTSYVFSATPTKRPISNSPFSVSTKNPNNYNYNPTPTVIILDVPNSGSGNKISSQSDNSEYFTPTQSVNFRPNVGGGLHNSPTITISHHVSASHGIQVLNNGATERPVPTVIITPKPTTNIVTASSWSNRPGSNRPTIINKVTMGVTTHLPMSSYGYSTTPKPPSTSYVYSPTVTRRPIQNPQSTTAGYGSLYVPQKVQDDYDQRPSQDDLINFPPVRNPNLNGSIMHLGTYNQHKNGTYLDYDDIDISTPSFIEDGALDDKIGLFVNKIVESLQGNFQGLTDVVYNNRNASQVLAANNQAKPQRPADVPQTSRPTRRPTSGTTTKRPTRRPTVPTRRPAGSNAPNRRTTTTKRPTTTTKRPATTTKRPLRATTTPTTKKPITTRKPKPTTQKVKPAPETAITTKRPQRLTTTTKNPKPTKRVTVPTTTVEFDEISEEETTTLSSASNVDYRRQCGVRPLFKTGRIVGGKGASFGQWPWQVLVRESTWLGLFTKNKCGGVLITNKFVMTAAHCQPGFLASLVAVFGEFDISGDLESKRSVTKNVKRVIVHRQYDAATFENDLALLELDSPLHYDSHIVPICMPPDNADFTGRMATVTGWGRLRYQGGVPSVLQEVQVPIIENSVCQEMFQTAGHAKKILGSFLCAGYANGQKDSCEGDSGGPLVLQRPDGRWQLAGTVSHGIKCAAPYLPGVYMRTTFFKPWLQSITGVH